MEDRNFPQSNKNINNLLHFQTKYQLKQNINEPKKKKGGGRGEGHPKIVTQYD